METEADTNVGTKHANRKRSIISDKFYAKCMRNCLRSEDGGLTFPWKLDFTEEVIFELEF